MSKLTIKGNNVHDILQAVGHAPRMPDIAINFRTSGYAQPSKLLPGLRIRPGHDIYKNREFLTLGEAIKYLRQLYREAHRADPR